MDFEDRPLQRQGHHQAHVDDITLRTADDFQLGVGHAFEIGPSDGIGSQDFNDLDLGIDWDGEPKNDVNDKSDLMSVDGSVGVGRDAYIGRDSLEPGFLQGHGYGADLDVFSHKSKSKDVSEAPFDIPMDIDIPGLGVDLTDFGVGFGDLPPLEDGEKTPGATRSMSRACA